MSYETAIASMYSLGHELSQTPSNKFDLAHMRVLLAPLGNPFDSRDAGFDSGCLGPKNGFVYIAAPGADQ